MKMQDLAKLVVSCEVLYKLKNLIAIFDHPQIEGLANPNHVFLGLRMLETLTMYKCKTLPTIHETPINIEGCILQLTFEPKTI